MGKHNGEKRGGFAIGTYDQDLIEENARERFSSEHGEHNFRDTMLRHKYIDSHGDLTEVGLAQLNKDIILLEKNALKWMKETFNNARDEGHGSDDDLVGTFWWDPTSKKQLEQLDVGLRERIDMTDPSYGSLSRTVWKGVSALGQETLGGAISFFDIDADEVEALLEKAR